MLGNALGFVLGAILICATFAAYWPVKDAGYIWDDDRHVTQNPALRSSKGFWRIWTDLGSLPQWYPLTHTTFWIEYQLWGEPEVRHEAALIKTARGFHIDNVFLHALSAVFVWRILRQLFASPGAELGAYLAGMIFALHPVHVESVAWITERKNVLSGLLYLMSLWSYLKFEGLLSSAVSSKSDGKRQTPDRFRRWPLYALSLVLFLAALLSKSVTCSLPAAILLIVWWKRGRFGPRQLLLLPFFAVGLGMAIVTAHLETEHVGASGTAWSFTWPQRVQIAQGALPFYLWKLIWPHPLIFMYDRWPLAENVSDWLVYWPAIAEGLLLATLIVLGVTWKRFGRGPAAAALFFCATLVPALGFFSVYPMRYSFVADHFQYLASLGPIALVGAGAASVFGRRSVWLPSSLGAIAAGLLAVLGLLTRLQISDYRDEITLWRHTIEKNPNCWMAMNDLGQLLLLRGNIAEASYWINKSLEINYSHSEALNNMGLVCFHQRKYDEALSYLNDAIKLDPSASFAFFNRGRAHFKLGHLSDALNDLDHAVELSPRFGPAYIRRAEVKADKRIGDLIGARNDLRVGMTLKARVPRDLTYLLGDAGAPQSTSAPEGVSVN